MTIEQYINEKREAARDPHYRLSLAVHEAGHVHYGYKLGAVGVKYHGACERPDHPGVVGEAAVELVFPKSGLDVTILGVATFLCAGDVFRRVLCPAFWRKGESESDKSQLKSDYCKSNNIVLTAEQVDAIYQKAEQEIERDLRSPAFRREMWALAREVEKKIPWGI